jgi:hypothetical protein
MKRVTLALEVPTAALVRRQTSERFPAERPLELNAARRRLMQEEMNERKGPAPR